MQIGECPLCVSRPRRQGAIMWTTGDRVLALRLPGDFWYPGIIRHIQDDRFFIIYDDGEDGFVKAKQMLPLALEAGDRVHGRWQLGQEFYPGVIASRAGEVVTIHYDDGDEETTLIRLLRLERDEWLPESAPSELGAGDRILGCWFDGMWYPGIILSAQGKRVHVLFDDNDQAYLTWDRIG